MDRLEVEPTLSLFGAAEKCRGLSKPKRTRRPNAIGETSGSLGPLSVAKPAPGLTPVSLLEGHDQCTPWFSRPVCLVC